MRYAINLVVLEEIRPFIILQIGVKTSYYINCEKNSIHRKRKQMQKKKEREQLAQFCEEHSFISTSTQL